MRAATRAAGSTGSTGRGFILFPLLTRLIRLKYEFVDTNLGGEPWTGRGAILATGAVSAAGRPLSRAPIPCARIFRRMRSGDVFSPRNVFMFGRGGAANLSCIYRIEAAANERVSELGSVRPSQAGPEMRLTFQFSPNGTLGTVSCAIGKPNSVFTSLFRILFKIYVIYILSNVWLIGDG